MTDFHNTPEKAIVKLALWLLLSGLSWAVMLMLCNRHDTPEERCACQIFWEVGTPSSLTQCLRESSP